MTGIANEVDLDYYNGSNVTSLETSKESDVSIVSHSHDVVAGRPMTVDVSVAGADRGSDVPAPTGNVTVSDGSSNCVAALTGTGGVATGSCSIAVADAGHSQVSASFPGDENWQSGATASPTTVTVGRVPSSVKLVPSKARVAVGDERSEHLTVTVSSGDTQVVPTGTVTPKAGSKRLCSVKLVASHGSCSLAAKELPAGKFLVQASYSGDANLTGSSSSKKALAVTK